MTLAALYVRYVKIKALPVYTCDRCGVSNIGDTYTLEERGFGLSPAHVLSNANVSNNHMPVGWTGFLVDGKNVHRCPDCVKEKST